MSSNTCTRTSTSARLRARPTSIRPRRARGASGPADDAEGGGPRARPLPPPAARAPQAPPPMTPTASDLDLRRRYFAEELEAVCKLRSPRLVEAFAQVPREQVLGPGPGTVVGDSD